MEVSWKGLGASWRSLEPSWGDVGGALEAWCKANADVTRGGRLLVTSFIGFFIRFATSRPPFHPSPKSDPGFFPIIFKEKEYIYIYIYMISV